MRRIFSDILILAASIWLAVYFVQADVVHALVSWTSGSVLTAAFVAGLFFPSLFTVAPATIVLGELAQHAPLLLVALAGGIGATLVDWGLYWFIKQRLGHHARRLTDGTRLQFVREALAHSRLRFVLSVVGALFIVLPLPDEVGLMLLGVSSVNKRSVVALVWSLNTVGILLIALVARTIV